MGKHNNKFRFHSVGLVRFTWSHRKLLLFVSVLTVIISVIWSLTITPKYKSAVTMFPASSASVSGSLLTESAFASNDILRFGGEQECEQLMQVLQSSEIRSRIIHKYNLAKHYKIDPSSKNYYYKLNLAFDGNIKYRRTEYMSIVAEVLDTDPDTAALIANDIAYYVDTVMNQIVHQRSQKAFELVKKEYQLLQDEIAILQDSMRIIREKGVLNYEAQSQSLSNAYAEAIKEGNNLAANKIEKQLKTLAKYGGAYVSLNSRLIKYNDRLAVLASKYQQAKVDAEQTLPYKYIVEQAYPSEVKAYPTRWIIVFATTLSAFALTLLLLIIRDTIHKKHKD